MNKSLFNFVKISVLTFLLLFSFEVALANPISTPNVGRQLTNPGQQTQVQTQEKGTFDKILDSFTPPAGSLLATMFSRTKNCDYANLGKYQPFSGIDSTFPGAASLGIESVQDKNGTGPTSCIDVKGGTGSLLSIFFTMGISIIIILSVINISIAGIQFMTEEASGQIKGGAKKRLLNSLIALGLGLLSYTILYTVNKQLVNFSFEPSQIDKDGSIDAGISSAKEANIVPTFWDQSSFNANQPSTPNSPFLYDNQPGNLVDAFNNIGSWNERVTDSWVLRLPNGERSTDGRLVVTVYSATKDDITDSNTRQRRGNRNNLLREGSVALSPDLISKYYPQTGEEIFINNVSIGFYEDATASQYKGVQFRNTVDIYDENGSLGGSYLKNIPAGQWSIRFGPNKRSQISNP